MSEQIHSIAQVKEMARKAVEERRTIADCPFAPGSSAYDHWAHEFHRVSIELCAEVES